MELGVQAKTYLGNRSNSAASWPAFYQYHHVLLKTGRRLGRFKMKRVYLSALEAYNSMFPSLTALKERM